MTGYLRHVLAAAAGVSLLFATGCSSGPAATTEKSAPPAAAAAAPAENVPETIAKLEHDWVKAIVAKDTATVERLMADDFTGTTDDMRYGKPEALDDVKDGTHESLELNNIEIHVYGDTAIATMNQTEKSQHGASKFDGNYLFTDTWVKRDGQWRAVASHGSRAR